MLNNHFKKNLLFLFLIFLSACASPMAPGADTDVGTIIYRPTMPTSLFPDFDSYLTETAIDSQTSSGTSTTTALRALTSSRSVTRTPSDSEASLSISGVWEDIFQGNLDEIRTGTQHLETFGTTFSPLITAQGFTEATDELQTITSTSELRLIDTTTTWNLEMIQDSTNSDYIRFYFRNQETGLLEATYVVTTDSSNNPIRGLFAWTDTSETTLGRRLFAMAFDFTNPSQNLAVIRVEKYHADLESYYTFQVHFQCDASTQNCLGEYNEILNSSTSRDLAAEGVRYSWNETTQDVCIADVDYSDGTLRTAATYEFTGPDISTDEVVTDSCTVTQPHWGSHIYTEADLPQHSTASQYYVDGISKTGWDTLTPSLIDTWLDASGF